MYAFHDSGDNLSKGFITCGQPLQTSLARMHDGMAVSTSQEASSIEDKHLITL